MSAIKKSELDKLGKKELEAKLAEFERAALELKGEGRPDKVRPLKKAIARINQLLSQDLNNANAESPSTEKKVREQK